jgi:hypothetical protein
MGSMPFHLEKGVMGLRFDYLTRSPECRQVLLQNLQQPGADPFQVARNIQVASPSGSIRINVIDDGMAGFTDRLQELWVLNPTQLPDHEERRTKADYIRDESGLDARNRDTPGNRQAFVSYWETLAPQANPNIKAEMAQALVSALTSGRQRIDYWWDCSQLDTDKPMVICSLDVPRVARVFFSTPHHGPHGAKESNVRGALPPR